MTFKIITNDDRLEIEPPVIYVVGGKGEGKTSFSITASERPLLIDIEQGAHRATHRVNLTVKVEKSGDITEAIKQLKGQYDSIVIDSASALSRICFNEALAKQKNPNVAGQHTYGELKSLYRRVMNQLPRDVPVIITGHLASWQDGDAKNPTTHYGIEATGLAVKEHVEQWSDAVCEIRNTEKGRFAMFRAGLYCADPCGLKDVNVDKYTMAQVIKAYYTLMDEKINGHLADTNSAETAPETDEVVVSAEDDGGPELAPEMQQELRRQLNEGNAQEKLAAKQTIEQMGHNVKDYLG